MKTTFYKKLVPLAMIASLAVSGAGALGAQTGLADLISANAIVAYAEEASTGYAWSVTSGTAAFTYDTLDADTAEASATVTITATKPAEGETTATAVTATELDAAKLSLKSGNTAVTGFTFAVADNATSGIDVTITAAMKDAKAGSYTLCYGVDEVGTVTVSSKTANATGEAKGTHVDNGKLTKYDGASTEIDLSKVSGLTTIGTGAFSGTAITSIKLTDNLTIEGNAFDGCSSLTTIDITGVSAITLGTAATADTEAVNAFGAEPNQYLTAIGTDVAPDVKEKFEKEGVEVLDTNAMGEDSIAVPAGTVLKVMSKNGAVVANGKTAQVKISAPDSTYYEGNFNFADIEKPTWKLVNPSTGKPASAAKFGAGKKFNKTSSSDEIALIGGTKANGKFNNSVILSTSTQQPRVNEDGNLVTGKKWVADANDATKGSWVDNTTGEGDKKETVYTEIKSTFDANATNGTYIGSSATMKAADYDALVKAVDELKATMDEAVADRDAANTAKDTAQTAYDAKMTEIFGSATYPEDGIGTGLKKTYKEADEDFGNKKVALKNAINALNAESNSTITANTNSAYNALTDAEIDALTVKNSSDFAENEEGYNELKSNVKNALAPFKTAFEALNTAQKNYNDACTALIGASVIDAAPDIKTNNVTTSLAYKLNAANNDATAKTTAATTATTNYSNLDKIKTDVEAQKSDITVSAEVKIYITPAAPTTWTPSSITAKTAKGVNFKPVTDAADDPYTGKGYDYVLEMEEGKSYSIPLKLKDGADKTLNYNTTSVDSNDSVTVTTKGKVKAINPNCTLTADGAINVATAEPQVIKVDAAEGNMEATVAVYVKPATTKTYTNTKSVIITGTEEAQITLGTVPASEKPVSYTVNVPDGYTATYTDANGNNGTVTSDTAFTAQGAVNLKVKDADGKEIAKTADLKVKADGTAKEVTVKLKAADAYQNVKSFKETGKKDKETGYRVVNMTAGSSYNLGLSVSPATADSKFELKVLDDMSSTGKVSIDGDVVTIDESGTYYVQATSNGIGQDKEKVESSIFEINVYSPAESLVTEGDYAIKGGYLMNNDNAAAECKKEFEPGQWINPGITIPGDEPITWKSSKPGVVPVEVDEDDNLSGIGLFGSGTFTITGTTQYTKQKYSFKVAVDKWTDAKLKPSKVNIVGDTEMTLKSKGQLYVDLANVTPAATTPEATAAEGDDLDTPKAPTGLAAKSVKFESNDKNIVSVTNAGAVTAKGVGTATITATITGDKVKGGTAPTVTTEKFTITVKSEPIVSNVKVTPTSNSGEFKVSYKAANTEKGTDLTWKYGADTTNGTALTVDKKKFTIKTKGDYVVWPCYKDSKGNTTEYPELAQPVSVYTNFANKAKVDIDAKAKTFSKGFLNADKTTTATATIIVGKEGDPAYDIDGIDWVSSNANVAWVSGTTNGSGNDKYATVTIGMDPTKATPEKGTKVTLTGTLKNGGKKVKITVNVGKENAPKPTDAPKPTEAPTDAPKA